MVSRRDWWRDYYKNNREHILELSRKRNKRWYKENRRKKLESNKIYNKTHPQRMLNNLYRYLQKQGNYFNKNSLEYKYCLMSWSKAVRQRDESCVICGSTEKLHAHHLIPRASYPYLSLNINNGITLCERHHREIHGGRLK